MRKTFLSALLSAFMVFPLGAASPDGRREVSLKECLEMSMRNDPYVRNTRLDISSARARKSEAVWEYFPNVSINGIGYYAINPLFTVGLKDLLGTSDMAWEINNRVTEFARNNGVKYSYSAFQHGYGLSLMAVQPIYAGGRIINGNKLATIGVEASKLMAEVKERDVREQVETKYWLVVGLQEKMKTVGAARNMLDSLFRSVTVAREAGLALESDVLQVIQKKKELASSEIQLRNGIKLAKMDLFNSIGMEYEFYRLDDFIFSDSVGELPHPSSLSLEDSGVPTESRLLGMQVEAKKLEKKMAVGEFLPEVGVGVGYGYENLQGYDRNPLNGIGFASVKIPITGIGKAAARADRYENEVRKVQNEKDFLDSQLALQQRQLFLAVDTAYDQMCVARDALSNISDAERRARADYSAGRIPVTQLLQAEVAVRVAREDYIDRCIDYKKALVAYECRYR